MQNNSNTVNESVKQWLATSEDNSTSRNVINNMPFFIFTNA